jgi:hypothetical protein
LKKETRNNLTYLTIIVIVLIFLSVLPRDDNGKTTTCLKIKEEGDANTTCLDDTKCNEYVKELEEEAE